MVSVKVLKSALLRFIRWSALKSGLSSVFGQGRLAYGLRQAYYRRYPLAYVRV